MCQHNKVENKKINPFTQICSLEKLTLFFPNTRDLFLFCFMVRKHSCLLCFPKISWNQFICAAWDRPCILGIYQLRTYFFRLAWQQLSFNFISKTDYKAVNNFRDPDQVLSLPYVLSLSHRWDLGKFKNFWQKLKYLPYKVVTWGFFFFVVVVVVLVFLLFVFNLGGCVVWFICFFKVLWMPHGTWITACFIL